MNIKGGPGWDRYRRNMDAEAIRLRTIELQQQAVREVAQRPSLATEKPSDYPQPRPRPTAKGKRK